MINQPLDNPTKNHPLLDEIFIIPSNELINDRFNPENVVKAAPCGASCGAGCGGGCGSGKR